MKETHFTLSATKRWLLHSILNEVLRGFKVDDFSNVIGIGKEKLRRLDVQLDGLPEGAAIELGLPEIIALHNALRECLRQFGRDEFHTRTGYGFEDGERTLRELHDMIKSAGRSSALPNL
jgi:hypothetical protein